MFVIQENIFFDSFLPLIDVAFCVVLWWLHSPCTITLFLLSDKRIRSYNSVTRLVYKYFCASCCNHFISRIFSLSLFDLSLQNPSHFFDEPKKTWLTVSFSFEPFFQSELFRQSLHQILTQRQRLPTKSPVLRREQLWTRWIRTLPDKRLRYEG